MQQLDGEDDATEIPIFTTEKMSKPLREKVHVLVDILNQKKIDIRKIKQFLAEGIPDEAFLLREYAWKLTLGYLPRSKDRWKEQIRKQGFIYSEFLKQYLSQAVYYDSPIKLNKKHQRWAELEKDFLLWQQIEKDTSRTQAELSFFSTEAAPIMLPFLTSARKEKHRMIHGDEKELQKDLQGQKLTYRFDYLTRILFIYSKVNPKVDYVQGMNEILAPIFYIVNAGKSNQAPIEEAACFFMFNNVMSDIVELHMKDLDRMENGVYSKLKDIGRMLLAVEPKLWQRLQLLNIEPLYYMFRWVTLLFSQEFPLYDTLRVWESIFSHEDRSFYVNCFAIALIIACKQHIINGDYSESLRKLKTIHEHVTVDDALELANEFYIQLKDTNIRTLAQNNKLKLEQQTKEKEGTKPKYRNRVTALWTKLRGRVNQFWSVSGSLGEIRDTEIVNAQFSSAGKIEDVEKGKPSHGRKTDIDKSRRFIKGKGLNTQIETAMAGNKNDVQIGKACLHK